MEKKKLSRKEREFLRHHHEILEAALELFSEKGFHNVTMNEIAKESEFAMGTLYKFFSNKEDLYRALILEKSEEFRPALMNALDNGKDEMESIKAYIETSIRLFMGNLKFIRLYFAETRGASFSIRAGLDKEIKESHEQILIKLTQVFEEGIRKGLFRSMDPYLMATGLEGFTHAFLLQYLDYGDEHPFDAGTVTKMFFKSILLNTDVTSDLGNSV